VSLPSSLSRNETGPRLEATSTRPRASAFMTVRLGHVPQIFSLLRVHRRASRGVGLAAHPSGRPLATAKTYGTGPDPIGPGESLAGSVRVLGTTS
jgi:hypothetical protein